MTTTIHNPDQYMVSLRQVVALGRKRIGFLVGAGAPAGTLVEGKPLIPAVAGLTEIVLESLPSTYRKTVEALSLEVKPLTIETLLSRVRSLSQVIGSAKVHGLDGPGYDELSKEICLKIGEVVKQDLPPGSTPFTEIVAWASGIARESPIEIFTTNYDLLFEQALERAKVSYFDGFTGSNEAFFDPASVASNDLPARWIRLWKLHGSLGWTRNSRGDVVRTGGKSTSHLVFPEHLKYDQTQKAPYAAYFDRLRDFLTTPDTLLISTGFSFADAHITARIDECLSENPSASVFAFQFKPLDEEQCAVEIASRRSNMAVFAPDGAVVNGIAAPWKVGELPSKDWGAIRATYWRRENPQTQPTFELGKFNVLARFLVTARAPQHQPPPAIPESAQQESEVAT